MDSPFYSAFFSHHKMQQRPTSAQLFSNFKHNNRWAEGRTLEIWLHGWLPAGQKARAFDSDLDLVA